MIEYGSRKYIERLEKNVDDCKNTSIKVATNAIGYTINAFNSNEIDEKETKRRIDKINELTAEFIDNCECSKK